MPYTLKTQQIAVKDPDTGEYSGVDILTEQTTEGLLNEIEVLGTQKKNDIIAEGNVTKTAVTNEGAAQITNVQNAGAATVTLVNNTVSQSQTAVDNLQQQRDDIVTSVTDMLSTGTDNSLTTPSVPADAKAVGDLYETIVVDSETQPNKRWNRIWVKPSSEEVEIPTMDEFENVLNLNCHKVILNNPWSRFATKKTPLGWASGYYDPDNAQRITSSRYMRLVTPIIFPVDCIMTISSFSSEFGVTCVELDKDGETHINTFGSNTATVLTIQIMAEHEYWIYLGMTPSGVHIDDYLNDECVNNIQIMLFLNKLDNSEPRQVYTLESDNNVRVYDKFDNSVIIYDDSKLPCWMVNGSSKIYLNDNDSLNILCSAIGNDYSSIEVYVYFYNSSGDINWDLFDYTNSITGEKNRITIGELMNLNGLQFANLPNDTYAVIAPVNTDSIRVIVWNGFHYGLPIKYSNCIYDENMNKIDMPLNGEKSIVVPPSYVKAVIAKNGYTFIRGVLSVAGVDSQFIPSTRFPAQIIPMDGYMGSGRSKNLIVVKNYNYSTGTYENVTSDAELMESIILLSDYRFEATKPVSNAKDVAEKANALTVNFTWSPVKDVNTYKALSKFKQGCLYSGVPYRSDWEHACYVGWHVTKHTFMNAVNDPDSIFYNDSKGAYYSLVCSAFATLTTGFPYPMTNFGLMKNPYVIKHKVSQPTIGELLTNGVTHCVVPLEIHSSSLTDEYAVKFAEEGSPLSLINCVYSLTKDNWGGIGSGYDYLYQYRYACAPKYFSNKTYGYIPYDVSTATITNGSARPHKGDRSVYTSEESVLINIKLQNANRLYYQKYEAECSYGLATSLTPVNNAVNYIEFNSGTKQVVLRSKTTNENYTGASLEDGAVYGVWASLNDTQSTPPDNIEFFEWHDNVHNRIQYSVDNGVLVSDNVFWYVRTSAANYRNPIRSDKTQGNLIIPYIAPGKTIEGIDKTHCDYSAFADDAYITSVKAFFLKGKFGAYVVTGDASGDDSDEEEEDPEY